jgi:hypothetical protein
MKKGFLIIGVVALIIATAVFAGCDTGTGDDEDINEDNTDAMSVVTFVNSTQFYVQVHQDAFSGPVVLELQPGETNATDARASENYGVGSTYCITYDFNVADEDDVYSGKVFAAGLDPNAQINFVIEKGKEYTKQIPIPDGIAFEGGYIRIKNRASSHFELAYLGTAYKQASNEELPVPVGKTGIYQFKDNLNITGYRLQSVFEEIAVPNITLQKGWIYDFVFTSEDDEPRVIQDVMWRIKPEPTSRWKKEIAEYRADNFTTSNSKLNLYLGCRPVTSSSLEILLQNKGISMYSE